MAARRAGCRCGSILGGRPRVRVYASGLGPDACRRDRARQARRRLSRVQAEGGHSVAKRDLANLARCAKRSATRRDDHVRREPGLGAGRSARAHRRARAASTALDRGTDRGRRASRRVEQSRRAQARSARRRREPARANRRSTRRSPAGYLRFVQPDVGKWGGISGCRAVASRAVERDTCVSARTGSPAASGLAASMHLLAAAGGGGYAEVDANPNPLREAVFPLVVVDGWATLSAHPGSASSPTWSASRLTSSTSRAVAPRSTPLPSVA